MGKKFVICSEHSEYVNRFSEYVADREELAFELTTCTSESTLEQLAEQGMIDILLIDSQVEATKRVKIVANKKFLLTDDRSCKVNEDEEELYIYQPADHILAQILDSCLENETQGIFRHVAKGDKELIGIYSPIHRIGKSQFALELARQLGKDKEVLYLSLEEYPCIGEHLKDERRNLSNLLYYARQDKDSLAVRIGAAVRKIQEVDVIPPIPVSQDLKEVEAADWQCLIAGIMDESLYQCVVLDLSESVRGLRQVMSMCSKLLMPVIDEAEAAAKLSQYKWEVRTMGEEEILGKTTEVLMTSDQSGCVRRLLHQERPGESVDNC